MAERLRVLVVPDKFAGTASAAQVARSLAAGWHRARPQDLLEELPLSDGGPGFLAALRAAMPRARLGAMPVSDPLGRAASAQVVVHGSTAYLESSQAVGLHLLGEAERDPLRASSRGVGELLAGAMRWVSPPGRVVLGLGGSGTVDGGLGMMRELGLAALDVRGDPVADGARGVCEVSRVAGIPSFPGQLELVVASDVTNPLVGAEGAATVYGPQKGLSPRWVRRVDAGLQTWARLLEAALPAAPEQLALARGAGAAGGLGAALLALGGRLVAGFDLVASAVALEERIRSADLVVTGEGRFDRTSLRGKVVGGVLAEARRCGVPAVVVAGQTALAPGDIPGTPTVRTLLARAGDTSVAMARTRELLEDEACHLAGHPEAVLVSKREGGPGVG